MVSCAADAGYDFLGLRLIAATPQGPHHDSVGDTPLVRETARRLADTGMAVRDIEIFRILPDTRIADFKAAMETGARLGARHATVGGQDEDFQRLVDNFAALCEIAAGFGIQCNIEPTPWTEISTLAGAARVVQASGRNNAGVLVDSIHFDRVQDDVAALAAYPAAYFPFMQLCDAPAERPTDMETLLHQARAERMMPGDGGIDLRAQLRGLPPGIPIALEIPMLSWAKTAPAVVRAKAMREKTLALLASLE
jgi:sugar phosphate isomerase/epimerase